MNRKTFVSLIFLCGCVTTIAAIRPIQHTVRRHRACVRVSSPFTMCEYSTKVKMTAETRAPLRQARIFFLYPATVAGASIATYVSVIRLIGGQDAVADSGNLLVNLAIIVAAIFAARADLKGRAELLQEVAIELGEVREPQTTGESLQVDESLTKGMLPLDDTRKKKRSGKKKK